MSDRERYRRALAAAERDSRGDGCCLVIALVIVAVAIGLMVLLRILPYA